MSLLQSAHNYVQNLCTIKEVHTLAAYAAGLLLADEAAKLAADVSNTQEGAQDASSTSDVTDDASTTENAPSDVSDAQEPASSDSAADDLHLTATFGALQADAKVA